MSSVLYLILLFSGLWSLSFCKTRQFYLVKVNKNWTEAQTYCRRNFTDLATTESQEDMDALLAALSGTTGRFWIGLNKLNKESWFWSDGSNFSYSDWYPTEPNNFNGIENCVDLWSQYGYKWIDVPCTISESFICYKEIPLILIKQNRTWREALRYCRENHVDLVSVHTEEVQRWVECLIDVNNASTANVWVGLCHTCTLRFWFWVSGESSCYQNWAAGNGTGWENCSGEERTGAVQTGSKQWISLPEYQTLNFICTTR